MVRNWRKNESALEQMPRNKRANRTGSTKFPQLENDLSRFIREKRASGRAITTVIIRRKAKEIAKEHGLTNFVGGPSWCNRFMKRVGLSIRARTSVGQRTPDNWEELMASFVDFTSRHVNTLHIDHDKIINMDEVPMAFDAPMTRTVANKGDKTVIITTTGHERTNFTVALACTASGRKLKLLIIFKRKTMPKESLPTGVVVLCNQKVKFDTHQISRLTSDFYNRRFL